MLDFEMKNFRGQGPKLTFLLYLFSTLNFQLSSQLRREGILKVFWLTITSIRRNLKITKRPFSEYFPEKHKFQFNFLSMLDVFYVSFDQNQTKHTKVHVLASL
jgi:hypothetical protein